METPTLNDNAIEVLHAFLKDLSMSGYTINAVPATAPGENFSSTIFRVQVKNGTTELSLIVKIAPANKSFRLIFPLRGMYEQEAFYYQQVFPEFEKIQTGISIPFRTYPKLFKAHLEDCSEVFILQDMKELKFRGYDRLVPLDYDHAVLVVKEYAKLHGASYALKKLKPETFNHLASNAQDKVFQSLTQSDLREKQLKERTAIALQALNPIKHKKEHDRFLKFSETMFYVVQKALRTESAGDYAVFTHSDSWICNYLFKYQDDKPTELCIVDWQLAHCGSPALDLCFFFFSCTDQELRKQHYEDLLEIYHSTLKSYLTEFKFEVQEILPFNVLKDHLKRFSAYGIYMATIVLNLTLLQGGKLPSLVDSKTESDMLKLRNVKDGKDRERYNSRMGGAILDFIEYGYDLCSNDVYLEN